MSATLTRGDTCPRCGSLMNVVDEERGLEACPECGLVEKGF